MKKTLVIGASPNAHRYAYHAVIRLAEKGHEVIPLGIKSGQIAGIPIQHGFPHLVDIDTVSLYINPSHQESYYEYLLKTIRPKRIIFNPGSENPELIQLAQAQGIATEIACTLVLLSLDSY